jgi:hypothetical protein
MQDAAGSLAADHECSDSRTSITLRQVFDLRYLRTMKLIDCRTANNISIVRAETARMKDMLTGQSSYYY